MRTKLFLAALLALAIAVLVAAGAASADVTTVPVTPTTSQWTQDDTTGGGSVSWTDAMGAPSGLGSAALELTTDETTSAKADLINHALSGMRLADLQQLGYWTYQRSASSTGGDASLQLQVLVNGTSGFTTLVFEPYENGTVANGQWQHWDAAAGQFWSTRTTPDGGLAAGHGGAPFYTLADVQGLYPDAVVVGVGVNVGTYNPGYDVGVDGVQVNDTVYDFEASGCATTTSGTTITLLDDCTETEPFTVLGGDTLDGAGHTITAADPAGGAFVGAAVENGGETMDVTNLTIEGDSAAVDCRPFTGIQFTNAGGSVTDTNVDQLLRNNLAARGCQNGLGILVDDTTSTSTRSVTLDGNTVSAYNKNGITVKGAASATITHNVVTGGGALGDGYAAQNGIQVSLGASASVIGNTVRGNDYTPPGVTACGLLLYKAGGVSATKNGLAYLRRDNTVSDNETDVCNFGKGGGFQPLD